MRNPPPPWTPAFVCRSEGRRAHDLPAVPFGNRAELLLVRRVHRPFRHLLEQLSGPAGGVQEQHAAYLDAGALPGMRHVSGIKAQVPGPPTVTASPILNVISP